MSRLAYYPTPATRRLGNFTLDACSLGLWGVGAGTALVFLLSVTPKVKNTLLLKIPVVRLLPLHTYVSRLYAPSQLSDYYEDKIPASDKPF
ncbi:hypothetical protein F5888DRAFT_1665055 [Russula emetica]|nr:hypothetical protein F5888DRAFT_1665055 [Russula emetica]